MDRPLRLLVYNHEYNVTRPVTITPSRTWGGEGALGCVLGFGALHRIPATLDEPPQGPGETLFEAHHQTHDDVQPSPGLPTPHQQQQQQQQDASNGQFEAIPTAAPAGDFLVPANMSFQSKSPPPPPGGGGGRAKKARAHHNVAPVSDMDEYFKEGEAKSKEEDYAPSSKGALPPPPKAGGKMPPPPPKSTTPGAGAKAEDGYVD
jgi:hypothetical protein